jgi:hypothetical protein
MNYYAQGGQAHGLKALAQELPKYGRYGDSIVAHINPEEAMMLKAMGGSGTINPQTGLPEFFFKKAIQSVVKPIQRAIGQANPLNPGSAAGKAIGSIPGVKEAQNLGTKVFQPIEKAVVQPASRGLASFDKAVGNTIPGGWGTIAQTVASMIPGGQPLAVGIGALNGSGVMRKGGSFNLQGAMIGGATAYATSELGEYLRAAGGNPDVAVNLLPGSEATAEQIAGQIANQTGSAVSAAPGSQAAMLAEQVAGMGSAGAQNVASALTAPTNSFTSNLMAGNLGIAAGQAGNAISDIGSSIVNAPGNAIDAVKNYDYSGALKNAGQGISDTGAGIKSVLTGNINPAATAAVKAGTIMSPTMATAGTIYGAMSLSDLDAQRDFLNQQKAAGNIAQAEYDQALAEINRQRDYAARVVKDSPFSTNPDRDVSIGETFYGRGGAEDTLYGRGSENSTLYAMGGSVDDESGMDEARGIMQGNLQKGLFGQGYAAGGTPRFLSGGGDGMSDSIKATINDSQPARLADGEFVIPADVVSHIGNGSSKAGAKQLYSMMNKVRKARTGNPKQGKQINPSKYLPA